MNDTQRKMLMTRIYQFGSYRYRQGMNAVRKVGGSTEEIIREKEQATVKSIKDMLDAEQDLTNV
tara:strand:+ start:151 stop:342 length:192 start_codon:yes stop_codon:yes gene_type:complete